MTRRVLRSTDLNVDLTSIWSYIAADDSTAADALIREIDSTIVQLAESPELGIRMDQIRAGLFCKPVKRRYLIFYESTDTELHLLRVLHSSRRYERLL